MDRREAGQLRGGLSSSSSAVMMRTAVAHFISLCMRRPQTKLPHLSLSSFHAHTHACTRTHMHAHTCMHTRTHTLKPFITELLGICHTILLPVEADHLQQPSSRAGTAMWTLRFSKCVSSREAMTSVSVVSHTHGALFDCFD